jgi:thermitase
VCWECRLMPVRISDDTGGYAAYSAMAAGLTWAADHGARVANISFGGASQSATVRSAAQYFQNHGGVVTASAGNSGVLLTDADNPYILTVSAVNGNDTLIPGSNYGNIVDLCAPGSGYTTSHGGQYGGGSGTSFAAPVVAGVAALVISANPGLTGQQVQDIVTSTVDDLGPVGRDVQYGAGRVNAARAVASALGAPSGPDNTPPLIDFIAPQANAMLTGAAAVSVNASDNVAVQSVDLLLDGNPVGHLASAPFTFSVNTTGLPNGPHSLLARATDTSTNTAEASVPINVMNGGADTMAPTISIASPGSGQVVSGQVAVQVAASDNVAVTRVELYIDGVLKGSSTSAPFSINWNARRASRGQHTLQSKAYDAAQNSGMSPSVTVTR